MTPEQWRLQEERDAEEARICDEYEHRFREDAPDDPPDGGLCADCERGLPAYQEHGSICPSCADERRAEATWDAIHDGDREPPHRGHVFNPETAGSE